MNKYTIIVENEKHYNAIIGLLSLLEKHPLVQIRDDDDNVVCGVAKEVKNMNSKLKSTWKIKTINSYCPHRKCFEDGTFCGISTLGKDWTANFLPCSEEICTLKEEPAVPFETFKLFFSSEETFNKALSLKPNCVDIGHSSHVLAFEIEEERDNFKLLCNKLKED